MGLNEQLRRLLRHRNRRAGPGNPEKYLTDSGSEPFKNRDETIAIRGGGKDYLVVQSTRWGPIIDNDSAVGRSRCAGPRTIERHQLRMFDLETAKNVEDALRVGESRRRARCRT
jgi:acyl-homoserine lactone acylase PvdQ